MTASAHYVAPASRRRFSNVQALRKTAGETPAAQVLLEAIHFADLARAAVTVVTDED